MPLTAEQVIRITREVTLGQTPPTLDTPEEGRFRVAVTKEIDAIAAAGQVVEIPFEYPGE